MTDAPIGRTNRDCQSKDTCERYMNWSGDGEFELKLGQRRCDWFIEKGK